MRKVRIKAIDNSFIYGTFFQETDNTITLTEANIGGVKSDTEVTFMKINMIYFYFEDKK